MALRELLKKITGGSSEREIARLQKIVEDVNEREAAFEELDDTALGAKTGEFRQRLADGETLDEILVEVFTAVREAAKRTVGMRHYDVQLIGGVILHQGKIVEMKTGEGKTLVATLPLYLSALEGKGVHLVTVNDYLARRDGGWMGPLFGALGMSVGLVVPQFSGLYDPDYVDPSGALEDERLVHWRPVPRKEAYQADVTYGTNNEFGFDYLRDNMARDLHQCVQGELYYAIIDEVDNVLIDEARTPLIISGPAEEPSGLYRRFAEIVRRLGASSAESVEQETPDGDYVLEERTQIVTLTEQGVERVERSLSEVRSGEGLYDAKHAHMLPYLDNALRAYVVHKRDKGYIVKNGEVIIVDEFTGRLMYGRRFSEGLHQAIEAKEKVAIRRESLTYATVTFQNFFRMYENLSGMTGTAKTEEEEFQKIYDLDVIELPTNVEYRATYGDLVTHERRASEIEEASFAGVLDGYSDVMVTVYDPQSPGENGRRYFKRLDFVDVIYATGDSKFRAVVDEIEALHEAGRPVLVGTIAIETSEQLSQMLHRRGVPHQVLNGKLHEKEAKIITEAGRLGAVTIATNMAGRGVDIKLGGNPEGRVASLLEEDFRKTAQGFAKDLLAGREKEVHSVIETKPGFSLDSIELAGTLQAEYESYERAVSQQNLARFIADQLLKEKVIGKKYHGPVVGLAESALREDWIDALDEARLPEGVSQRVIGEIQRVRAQYESPGSKMTYIADGLFGHYYAAMSALIRAVFQDRQEQALALVQEYPELDEALIARIAHIVDQREQDRQRVCDLGGLHVIGTERHEARRIDNQLRGRAGRQGDPGSSRFYISLDDELMRRFGGERVQGLMGRIAVEGDVPIQHSLLDKSIESAQKRVEGANFDTRKYVLEYDDVVNKQRVVIYAQRRQVLTAPDLRDQVSRMIQEEIGRLVAAHVSGSNSDDLDLRGLHQELLTFLPLPPEADPVRWAKMAPDEIEAELCEMAESLYGELNHKLAGRWLDQLQKENATLQSLSESADPMRRLAYERILDRLGPDPAPDLLDTPIRKLTPQVRSEVEAGFEDSFRLYRDRRLMLGAVDNLWVRHLTTLASLREGIGLRAYGQQNPLVSYRKESYEMYEALLASIQQTVARSAYLVARPAAAQPAAARPQRRRAQQGRSRQAARGAPDQLPGRNDPCWCGSGVKYKNCHMRLDREQQPRAAAVRPPRAAPGKKGNRRRRRRS